MASRLDLGIGVDVLDSDLKKTQAKLDALYKKYQNKSINVGVGTKTTSKNIKTLDTNIKSVSKSTDEFGGRMKTAISSTIQWSLAVGGLYGVINQLKDAVQFTSDFDSSLTEIAMVTNQTREEVADLKDEYIELGKAISVSSLELANSAVALYRQGLAADEVNSRLVQISQTAKVAGLSVEQVTTAVTAGVNSMNVSAEEFTDTLLKIASVSATDFDKLSRALSKSASSLSSAGFDLQQGASAIAVIQEVTQESAESIGTSLKSVVARFNKLNEAGQDNTDTLNQIDEALKSVGLSLSDSTGQLKDVDVVLGELSPKWNELTKNQQAYLTTQIAGSRQANRFLVLMNNYNRMLEIQGEAYDSAGTRQEQYLKFQESIGGKLGKLQATFEEFYNSLVSENEIKSSIESLTQFGEVLIWLNKTMSAVTKSGGGLEAVLKTLFPAASSLATTIDNINRIKIHGFASDAEIEISKLVESINGVTEATKKMAEVDTPKVITDLDRLKELLDYEEGIEEIEQLERVMKHYGDSIPKYVTNRMEELQNKFEPIITAENNLRKEQDALTRSMYELYGAIRNEENALVEDTENAIRAMYEFNAAFRANEDASKSLIDNTYSLRNAMLDFISTGELTEQQLSLLEESMGLLNLSSEDGKDKIYDLAKQYGISAEDMIQFQIEITTNAIEEVKKRIKAYDVELDAINKLMEVAQMTDTIKLEKQFFGVQSNLKSQLSFLDTLKGSVSDLEARYSDLTSATTSTKNETKELTESFEDLSDQINLENITSVENYRDAINEQLEDELSHLDDVREDYEEFYQDKTDAIDAQIDAMNEQRDIEDEIANIQEKQVELLEAQEALRNVSKERNTRVLLESGWEWVANPSAVAEAEDNVKSLQEEIIALQEDQTFNSNIRKLESDKEYWEEAERVALEGVDAQEKVLDDLMDSLDKITGNGYVDILNNLKSFVSDYLSEISKIKSISVPSLASTGGSPTSQKEADIQQMKLNSLRWTNEPENRAELANQNLELGAKYGMDRTSSGVWMENGSEVYKKYNNGGIDSTGGMAMLHGTPNTPELILNGKQQSQLLFNMANSNMNLPQVNKSPISSGSSTTIQNLQITAPNGATLSGLINDANNLINGNG